MKHLILGMSILALISCKNNEKHTNSTEEHGAQETVDTTKEAHDDDAINVYANDWVGKIQKNNELKWPANAETNEGVEKMKNSIKTISTTTVPEYHQLAVQLDDEKNYVVKNCTMKGASHDNLHIWLMPLIAKIKALSETKTVDDGEKIKSSIVENINGYADYFE